MSTDSPDRNFAGHPDEDAKKPDETMVPAVEAAKPHITRSPRTLAGQFFEQAYALWTADSGDMVQSGPGILAEYQSYDDDENSIDGVEKAFRDLHVAGLGDPVQWKDVAHRLDVASRNMKAVADQSWWDLTTPRAKAVFKEGIAAFLQRTNPDRKEALEKLGALARASEPWRLPPEEEARWESARSFLEMDSLAAALQALHKLASEIAEVVQRQQEGGRVLGKAKGDEVQNTGSGE